MDTKIEIKEEDPLSDSITSQDGRDFCHEVVTKKTMNDAVLLDHDCDMTIKTEIKSESPAPSSCSKNERECFSNYDLMPITGSNSWEIDTETEAEEQTLLSVYGSQSDKKILPDDPVMKIKKYDDHERVNKIEIKVEPWWPGTETSSLHDNIKGGDFPSVKFSRLYTAADSDDSSGKSSSLLVEISGRETSFYNGNHQSECESSESDVTEVATVEEHIHSGQSGKCTNVSEINGSVLYFKQKNLIQKSERLYKCKTCDKSFTRLSNLKRHNLTHEGKKPHQCKTCDKSFTRSSHLKRHSLIHEGKKLHLCKICDKSFTQLTHLKRHYLIHEGKKSYECKICCKSFIHLSHLKIHNVIHEGKKPHKCNTCDKSFTCLAHLKRHHLTHEGKKPYHCKTCDKSFTRFSDLNRHNLIHYRN